MADWVEKYFQSKHTERAAKGGPGSGHHGHAGRPGKRGGSVPGNVAVSVRTGRAASERQGSASGGGEKKPGPINRELDGWSDLPKDLTKLTDQQHKDVIKFLAKKPLKELRRRQELIQAQREMAYEQGNTVGLNNLQVMDQHVIQAIMAREFPETADWLND